MGGMQQERRLVVRLEMQVSQHAGVRDMHSEVEIPRRHRPVN